MRYNKKKLTACALTAILGVSCAVYPVHAQETGTSQQSDTNGLLELDETAVPMDETTVETPVNTESNMKVQDNQSSTEDNEPASQEPTETKDNSDTPDSEPEQTAEISNTNAPAAQPEPQVENDRTPYANDTGDFTVTGGTSGTDWIYDSGSNTLTFKNSGTYTVTGNGQETQEQINIDANFVGTITIQNVYAEKMTVNNTAQLTLMLEGANTLKKGLDFSDAVTGTLTINSDTNGSLTTTGYDYGAGIGGGNEKFSGNNITINGGTIIATGGLNGAGIGGGSEGSGNNITIHGGTVTATSYYAAAGIGGGWRGSGNNITVNGGTIIATGSVNGAGIGGGPAGSGNNIAINGGNITAQGGDVAAGIGGGNLGSASGIIISGGIVTATGGRYGAGIGTEIYGTTSDITISGGTVTATGGQKADGIGSSSEYGSANNIKISGGSVKASSIGATPTDEKGENVYLIKIENLSGIDTVTVDETSTYKRTGNHPDNDGAFYLYLTQGTYTISAGEKTYIAEWNGSDFVIKQPSIKPTVTVQSKTASSITVQPLEQQETYGEAEYSLDGYNWQTNNVLTGLHSSTNYTVYARYKGNGSYLQSEAGKIENVSTNVANYTITIPAEPVIAGNENSKAELKPSSEFDLGHNGTATVKVKKNSGVDNDGKLTLTRQNDTENYTITSALLVNNNTLGDINKSVATFTMDNKTPVSVSFDSPTSESGTIPAGTYNGTITFEVSYSEK